MEYHDSLKMLLDPKPRLHYSVPKFEVKPKQVIHMSQEYTPDLDDRVDAFDDKHDLHRVFSLPSLQQCLLDACIDPLRSQHQLIKLVSYDPIVVARLIEAHTQNIGADTSTQPESIEAIIANVDKQQIKALIQASLLKRTHHFEDGNTASLEVTQQQWLHAMLVANLCRILAYQFDYAKPERAYYTGLLSNLGEWLMHSQYPDSYTQVIQPCETHRERLNAEKSEYGYDHIEATARIMRNWTIDSDVLRAIQFSYCNSHQLEDAPALTRLLFLARGIATNNAVNLQTLEIQAQRLFNHPNVNLLALVDATLNQLSDLVKTLQLNVPTTDLPKLLAPLFIDEAFNNNTTEAQKSVTLNQTSQLYGTIDGAGALFSQIQTHQALERQAHCMSQAIFESTGCLYFDIPANRQDCLSNKAFADTLTISTTNTSSLVAQCFRDAAPCDSSQRPNERLAVIDQEIVLQLQAHTLIFLPVHVDHALTAKTPCGVLVLGFTDSGYKIWKRQAVALQYFAYQIGLQWQRINLSNTFLHQTVDTEKRLYANTLKRIVHEVSNPLSIAMNIVHLLGRRDDNSPDAQTSLENIQLEIERASTLLKKYSDQQCQAQPSHTLVNINDLIVKLVTVFTDSFLEKKSISTEYQLDDSIPPVYIDSQSIKQILTNLIKNAAESMASGGVISLHTNDKIIIDNRSYVEILVVDTGPGIPDTLLEQLFSPVKSEKGAGLGLSIVRELTQIMDGLVSYKRSSDKSIFGIYIKRQTREPANSEN